MATEFTTGAQQRAETRSLRTSIKHDIVIDTYLATLYVQNIRKGEYRYGKSTDGNSICGEVGYRSPSFTECEVYYVALSTAIS